MEQAERWGLVTELAADPGKAALALAREFAAKLPSAILTAKASIGVVDRASEKDILLAAQRAQAALAGQPEQLQLINARFANHYESDFAKFRDALRRGL